MKMRWLTSMVIIFVISVIGAGLFAAREDDDDKRQFPKNATFTTLITTPRPIEGLTGDNHRNLYTGGSGMPPCPIWQINLNNPALTEVGSVKPAAGNCGFSGIAFDESGDLFVADGAAGTIYTFKPNANTPPTATVFAAGAPGSEWTCLRQARESLGQRRHDRSGKSLENNRLRRKLHCRAAG